MGRRVLSNGSICTLQKSTDFKKVCSKALLPHLQTIPRGRFFIMGLVFPSLLSLSIRSPRSPDCPRSPRKRRQPSPSPSSSSPFLCFDALFFLVASIRRLCYRGPQPVHPPGRVRRRGRRPPRLPGDLLRRQWKVRTDSARFHKGRSCWVPYRNTEVRTGSSSYVFYEGRR